MRILSTILSICLLQCLSAAELDSLLTDFRHEKVKAAYGNFAGHYTGDDFYGMKASEIPDSIFIARLNSINSLIPLQYNEDVRKYITIYTEKEKYALGKRLGLGHYYYFPIIENELDKAGLPLEFKALPVVESALIPTAISHSGASGLWQLMLGTGRAYGLEINTLVDERLSPRKSTYAVCQYLTKLYEIYNDWSLAIAAYNCGSGTISRALKKVPGAKNVWDIYYHIPQVTRDFIPKFVAINYVYNFAAAHGIEPVMPQYPVATDTVMIRKRVSFDALTAKTNIPIEEIKWLNPEYKHGIIPANYPLVLPINSLASFIACEEELYKEVSKLVEPKPAVAMVPQTNNKTYKIKKGDTLGEIAKSQGVSLKNLMRINNITDTRRIQIGQKLIIR